MPLHRTGVAAFLVPLLASVALASVAPVGQTGVAETRADLDTVVVRHVTALLSDRFGPAWRRVHPVDRRAIGRKLWQGCKRSSGGSLAAVRYLGVDVVDSRPVTFSSELHRRIDAVAETVEVYATLDSVPFTAQGTSHWTLADGRWARVVEQPKLAAYSVGRCPA